jgi:hypothetical protein
MAGSADNRNAFHSNRFRLYSEGAEGHEAVAVEAGKIF